MSAHTEHLCVHVHTSITDWSFFGAAWPSLRMCSVCEHINKHKARSSSVRVGREAETSQHKEPDYHEVLQERDNPKDLSAGGRITLKLI